jgi:hypothetical protein
MTLLGGFALLSLRIRTRLGPDIAHVVSRGKKHRVISATVRRLREQKTR